MEDKRIQDLTAASEINDNDYFVLEQGGEAMKLMGELLKDYINRNILSVTVSQLPAGSQPTVSFNTQTGALSLGIPKGDTGAQGEQGPAGSDAEVTAENIATALGYTPYQKPLTGIPKADLDSGIQASLGKADTALQEHQSLSAYRTAAAQDAIDDTQDSAIAAKYTKPDAGIPAADLAEDVQTSLDRANSAALPDGYYGESGGVFQYSTNFLGKNAPTDAKDLVFRPTASNFSGQDWSADSIGGQTATIERIKGKTLVFNQIVRVSQNDAVFVFPNQGVFLSVYNGTKTIADGKIVLTPTAGKTSVSWYVNNPDLGYANKKYFLAFRVTSNTNAVIGGNSINANKLTYVSMLKSFGADVSFSCSFQKPDRQAFDGTETFTIDPESVNCYCLTQVYGAGREPQTIEEFKAQFPLDFYQFSQGELVSFNGTGLKTTGFNQLYPDGHIDVLAGLTYKIEGTYISLKDSAGNDVTVTDNEFTPIADDTYTMVGGTCVHLKWSGVRDGETEPHWDSTLDLPVATYFPDGMNGAGTAYDELTKDKAIKRFGKVDLGTCSWYEYKTGGYYSPSIINLIKKPSSSYEIANAMAEKFITKAQDESLVAGDLAIGIDGRILAVTGTSNTPTGILYYELADPVETPISPALNLTYRCDDFGTEMLLPQNTDEPVTAPMDADIVYQLDYEAQIRNNNSLNITKESMDAFISAFNASGLGTITQTWDSANKRYAYTVTAPQLEPAEGGETV